MKHSFFSHLYDHLQGIDFPLNELSRHPISTIETMATTQKGHAHGVCNIGCLGCCADAVHPRDSDKGAVLLSVKQFSKFLEFAEFLSTKGIEILSLGRLILFSASNELDHPQANNFRQLLSNYLVKQHGIPLGHLASDLVFHVSSNKVFLRNLQFAVWNQPTLWDNICIAIDEQIPFKNKKHYSLYLEALSEVWRILKPALKSELTHAKLTRRGEPRVILNFLITDRNDMFRNEYLHLYPGGPLRSTTNEELIDRYVKPFVGDLIVLDEKPPIGHRFTTGISTLGGVTNSKVFVASNIYANQGRAEKLIKFKKGGKKRIHPYINTKLLPVDDKRIQIQASFASGFTAVDEIHDSTISIPEWINHMNGTIINLYN